MVRINDSKESGPACFQNHFWFSDQPFKEICMSRSSQSLTRDLQRMSWRMSTCYNQFLPAADGLAYGRTAEIEGTRGCSTDHPWVTPMWWSVGAALESSKGLAASPLLGMDATASGEGMLGDLHPFGCCFSNQTLVPPPSKRSVHRVAGGTLLPPVWTHRSDTAPRPLPEQRDRAR